MSDFMSYLHDGVARVALMVTSEEQAVLHDLANMKATVAEAHLGEFKVNIDEKVLEAVTDKLAEFKTEVLAEVSALVDAAVRRLPVIAPEPAKTEPTTEPAAPAADTAPPAAG